MYTVEYRFGRNVKGVPMDSERWADFLTHARVTLEGVARGAQNCTVTKLNQWVETHIGGGTWVNDAGETEYEESAVVTLYSDCVDFDPSHEDFGLTVELLLEIASELASDFDQEAIALVIGESVLATQKVGA